MGHLCTKFDFYDNINLIERKNEIMKIKRFDVVELNDRNRATIIDIKDKNEYFAEIVNAYGITVNKRIITENEINKVIYSREKVR